MLRNEAAWFRRGADAAPAQSESTVPFGRAAHRRPYGGCGIRGRHEWRPYGGCGICGRQVWRPYEGAGNADAKNGVPTEDAASADAMNGVPTANAASADANYGVPTTTCAANCNSTLHTQLSTLNSSALCRSYSSHSGRYLATLASCSSRVLEKASTPEVGSVAQKYR